MAWVSCELKHKVSPHCLEGYLRVTRLIVECVSAGREVLPSRQKYYPVLMSLGVSVAWTDTMDDFSCPQHDLDCVIFGCVSIYALMVTGYPSPEIRVMVTRVRLTTDQGIADFVTIGSSHVRKGDSNSAQA